MLNSMRKVRKILLTQLFLVLVVATFFLISVGKKFAISSAIGGGICTISQSALAFLAFRNGGAQKAKEIVMGFFVGEFLKISLTALMFSSVLLWGGVEVLPLLVGYIMAQLGLWVAPIIFKL